MAKADIAEKKVTTPKFRASYVHVEKPHAMKGSEPRYGVTMLFDKKTDISALKGAVNAAIIEKYGSLEKKPKGFAMPFRDGDGLNQNGEKHPPEYKGCVFVAAKCKEQPGVVDRAKEEILDLKEFYSGCYARATVIAFVYEEPKAGASFALLNLQKWADGKKIGGKKEAKDDFDEIPEDDETDADDQSDASADDDSDGGF